jgi:hypothetical protein
MIWRFPRHAPVRDPRAYPGTRAGDALP